MLNISDNEEKPSNVDRRNNELMTCVSSDYITVGPRHAHQELQATSDLQYCTLQGAECQPVHAEDPRVPQRDRCPARVEVRLIYIFFQHCSKYCLK